MKVRITAYGIAREMTGGIATIEVTGTTVRDIRNTLLESYPALRELSSLMIAVNEAYADDQTVVQTGDEVVLIPPVSGG